MRRDLLQKMEGPWYWWSGDRIELLFITLTMKTMLTWRLYNKPTWMQFRNTNCAWWCVDTRFCLTESCVNLPERKLLELKADARPVHSKPFLIPKKQWEVLKNMKPPCERCVGTSRSNGTPRLPQFQYSQKGLLSLMRVGLYMTRKRMPAT